MSDTVRELRKAIKANGYSRVVIATHPDSVEIHVEGSSSHKIMVEDVLRIASRFDIGKVYVSAALNY
jgi:uncharacterized NAD-dependent epimerase/dehydratase family protein